MKIASTIAVVVTLVAATAARGQALDLSRMKCKELIELPKDTIAGLTIWLDGYLTDDEEPRVVDLAQMRMRAEKLGLYCAQNPSVRILSAAEDVLEK